MFWFCQKGWSTPRVSMWRVRYCAVRKRFSFVCVFDVCTKFLKMSRCWDYYGELALWWGSAKLSWRLSTKSECQRICLPFPRNSKPVSLPLSLPCRSKELCNGKEDTKKLKPCRPGQLKTFNLLPVNSWKGYYYLTSGLPLFLFRFKPHHQGHSYECIKLASVIFFL